MKSKHIVGLILVLFFSTPLSLTAQDKAVVQIQPSKTPPTLPVLYRCFLAYQLHLERRADALKQAGKDGEDLRTHYQKVLGFSDQEFAKLNQAAVDLDKTLRAKDSEARTIINNARAASPKGPLPKGWILPPPPPQLKTLQAEREVIINSEITTLRKELTPADAAKLETFLQKDFVSAVTVGTPLPYHTSSRSLLAPEVKP